MIKKYITPVVFSIATTFASFAVADDYPSKTITVVNPYTPGSNAELQARHVAKFLEKDLGVRVDVENRSGGAASIGMNHVKSARPDGYTIIFTATGPSVVLPNTLKTGYTVADNFEPIAQVSSTPYTLSVRKDSGIESVDDFVEYAKNTHTTYGSSGAGLHNHLVFDSFFNNQNLNTTHIAGQGGAASVISLLGGHIDAAAVSLPDVVPYYKSGDFNILGVTTEERLKNLPDIKTFKEQGYDVVAGAWFGFLAPKGTSAERVKVLEESIAKAMNDSEIKDAFYRIGIDVDYLPSDAFSKIIEKDNEAVKEMLKSASL